MIHPYKFTAYAGRIRKLIANPNWGVAQGSLSGSLLAYWGVVLSATAFVTYSALTSEPTQAKSAIGWASVGWTPSPAVGMVWCLGFLLLVFVPFYPLTGILVYVGLMYGVARYRPELEYAYLHYFHEWIMGLTLFGWFVWRRRETSESLTIRHPASLVLTLLLIWVGISTFVAVVFGQYGPIDPTHRPSRFLCAGIGFMVVATGLRTRAELAALAACLIVALVVRDWVWPSLTYLDGDISVLAVMAFPMAIAAARSCVHPLSVFGFYLAAAVAVWILYSTNNRAGGVAFVAALLTFWIGSRRKAMTFVVGVPLAVLAGVWFRKTEYWSRFADKIHRDGEFVGSARSRLDIWEAGLRLFYEQPVFGSGPGTYARRLESLESSLGQYVAHNNLLELLVEGGVLSVVLYLSFFAIVLYSAGRIRWQFGDRSTGGVAVAIGAAVVAYLAAGLFVSRQDLPLAYMFAGVIVGLDCRTRDRHSDKQATGTASIETASAVMTPTAEKESCGSRLKSFRCLYAGLACLVAMLLIYGSLVPFRFVPLSFADAAQQYREMFQVAWGVQGSRIDWSVNYLVTIPFGFFGMGALLARRSSIFRVVVAVLSVFTVATVLTCGVEFGQVWFARRVPSLKDIVSQSLGTASGITAWILFGQRFTIWLASFSGRHGPREKTEWVLQAFVLGFVVYSLLPLDVITTPRELIYKYESGKFELLPFSYSHQSAWRAAYSYITQIALYVPIGLWTPLAWRARGQRLRPVSSSLLLGVSVAVGIEAAQGLIVSRYTSTTDLLLGTIGVAFGVIMMERWRNLAGAERESALDPGGRKAAAWGLAAIAYAAVLAAVFWAPYEFSQDRELIKGRLADFSSLPLARMQQGSDMAAFYSALRMIVWFMPLGGLIGAGIARLGAGPAMTRCLLVLGTLVVAAFALGIEVIQVFLPSKFADITDVAVSAAGGGVGLWGIAMLLRGRDKRG